MDGGLESRCVGRVYGADGAVYGTNRTCRAKNTSIKLLCCINLPLHFISIEVISGIWRFQLRICSDTHFCTYGKSCNNYA